MKTISITGDFTKAEMLSMITEVRRIERLHPERIFLITVDDSVVTADQAEALVRWVTDNGKVIRAPRDAFPH